METKHKRADPAPLAADRSIAISQDITPAPQDHGRPSIPLPAPAGDGPAGTAFRVLSAEASPAIIRQMRASGVIAYLTKPLDLSELGQLLDSFAAGHNHEASLALGTGPTP